MSWLRDRLRRWLGVPSAEYIRHLVLREMAVRTSVQAAVEGANKAHKLANARSAAALADDILNPTGVLDPKGSEPTQIGKINMRTSDMQGAALACLKIAASEQGGTPEQIVQRAEAYFAFVTGIAPKQGPAANSDTEVK